MDEFLKDDCKKKQLNKKFTNFLIIKLTSQICKFFNLQIKFKTTFLLYDHFFFLDKLVQFGLKNKYKNHSCSHSNHNAQSR